MAGETAVAERFWSPCCWDWCRACRVQGRAQLSTPWDTGAARLQGGGRRVRLCRRRIRQGGTWKPASPSDGMLRGKWWEVYQDPQLNALEEQIAPQNQNCARRWRAYLWRADQVRVARADFYPTLSVTGAVSRDQVSSHRPLIRRERRQPTAISNWRARQAGSRTCGDGCAGRWRLHRRMRRPSCGRPGELDLSLHAELALDYFELRGLDSDARLLERTVTGLSASARSESAAGEGRLGDRGRGGAGIDPVGDHAGATGGCE